MTQFLPPHLPHGGGKYYRRGCKVPKGFYRITVKGIILNQNREIFLLREGRYSDTESEYYRASFTVWDLPGGGLNWGDDFRSGLIREIGEELGLTYHEDYLIARDPLSLQITELDDRYYNDREQDDFYPVLMMYFPVKLKQLHPMKAPKGTEFMWIPIDKYKDIGVWSHIQNLATTFQFEDFPKEYIS